MSVPRGQCTIDLYLDEWKRTGLRVMMELTCIDRQHDAREDGHHGTWE